jgi:hypothetical protein
MMSAPHSWLQAGNRKNQLLLPEHTVPDVGSISFRCNQLAAFRHHKEDENRKAKRVSRSNYESGGDFHFACLHESESLRAANAETAVHGEVF